MELNGRIVIVRNPVSTHADRVQGDVVDPLRDEFDAPGQIHELWTPNALRSDIQDSIHDTIEPGDTVVVAAGDGTGNVVAEALLAAGVEGVRVGFLPYGNFNDMAATFSGRSGKHNPAKYLSQAQTVNVHPLDIVVNAEHQRTALLAMTLGWTARSASIFSGDQYRNSLESRRPNVAMSIAKIAGNYFAERKNAILPPFEVNGMPQAKLATDIVAMNGPIMASIIRSGANYYAGDSFLHTNLNVASLPPNAVYLGKSACNLIFGTKLALPGTERTDAHIHFATSTGIDMQMDGECEHFPDVSSLQISKNPRQVLHVLKAA